MATVEVTRLAVRMAGGETRRRMKKWLISSTVTRPMMRRAGGGPGGPDGLVKLEEAIEVIRPLADAGDDLAELWLARWLADCDRLDEFPKLFGHVTLD